jgi:hypothetical protein
MDQTPIRRPYLEGAKDLPLTISLSRALQVHAQAPN